MFKQLQSLKSGDILRQTIQKDFATLLQEVGLSEIKIKEAILKFFELIDNEVPQQTLELEFRRFIYSINDGDESFDVLLGNLQKKRAERVYSEITEFIDTGSKVLDFGCGNGSVAQMLFDRKNINIEGCDVVIYKGENIRIPMHKFDGYRLEVANNHYEVGYANSVIHHDVDPQKVINEITRIVSKKFILIEDTLQGNTPAELDFHAKRLFINDYIYNRLLTESDIPVPGTYKTSGDWIEAFVSFGWKLSNRKDLGWSKILPAVFREMFIFERK